MKKIYALIMTLLTLNATVFSMKRLAEGTIEQGGEKKVKVQPGALLYTLKNGRTIELNQEAIVLCDLLVDLLSLSEFPQTDLNLTEVFAPLALNDDEIALLFHILNTITQSARSYTDPQSQKRYYLNQDVFDITVRMCRERNSINITILTKLINTCDFLMCPTLLNALTRQFVEGSKKLIQGGFYIFDKFSTNSGAVPYLEKHLKRMILSTKLNRYILECNAIDYVIIMGVLPINNNQILLDNSQNRIKLTSIDGLEIVAHTIDKLSITSIDLSDNYLTLTHNFTALKFFPNIQELNLSHNQLTELPENIFNNLNQLQILWLSGNQLTQLPENIFNNLNQLQILWLNGNQLTQLPENIFQKLIQLQTLWLSGNKLTQLPENIFNNLNQLEELSLSHNQLIQLPTNIFNNLNQLTELHLSNNKLTQLPENIFNNLNQLQILDLDDNELAELPDNIQQLLDRLNEG